MSELPDCGLYRTTSALPGKEDAVGAGRLVYFHNHSDAGPPLLLMPARNVHNRWTFADKGFLVEDLDYCSSLQALKPEGLWRLREHIHPDSEHVVAKNALVQLGYNAAGESIIFFPRTAEGVNGIVFPERGTKIPDKIVALLEPLDTHGPRKNRQLH